MTNSAKILLVDDETAIADNLAAFLTRAGFVTHIANDGEAALQAISEWQPDLMVLDVLMPKLDGRAVLRHLRGEGNWLPVILLTQVGEASERAMALEEGADDYLNKPFDPYELAARIRSVLRRAQPNQPPLAAARELNAGILSLNQAAHRVFLQGQELSLTPKAVALLTYLMTHPDEVISRERLLDVVWGWDYPAGTRTVDTRVAELRKALSDDAGNPQYIETVTGMGYRFVGKVERQA